MANAEKETVVLQSAVHLVAFCCCIASVVVQDSTATRNGLIMKSERVPYLGAVRPRFKPNTRSNISNKIKLEASIQRRNLWRSIKARFKYNLHIYDCLQTKVEKYKDGRKSITQLSSDAAVLLRGHPDLIDKFYKWIPMTTQDSCTLLCLHLATTNLENRDLQDKNYDEVSTDTDFDTDTHTDTESDSDTYLHKDWNGQLKSSFKPGGCTYSRNLWKKIKGRFKCNLDLDTYDSLQNKVLKYRDGRKSITQLSSDVATLLRGHPDLIDEFRKWIPITPNNNLQDKESHEVSTDTGFSSNDTNTDIDTDTDTDMSDAMD